MSKNQKQQVLVQNILDKIGGPQNVKDVYHCATRMRITLYNDEVAKINEIKTIANLNGALWSNGELQIIIGPEVSTVTNLFKTQVKSGQEDKANVAFQTNGLVKEKNVNLGKRFLKSVSAIFGPLIPFLIGVGLIMALQQLLHRMGAITIPGDDVKSNIFDIILNVIASTGFKMMGVIAMWSTVRYLGGKTPIAIALALIMVSPILPSEGIELFAIGSWEIMLKPFYSTILVFIAMGVVVAYGQKLMDRYFNPVANFILNPFLSLLVGGMLAFFVMGPIMGVVENAMLTGFNWFMTMPFGLGALIVGLTWQPLVVLGVHNILFFAATTALTTTGEPSIFLAAAFAAAWGQMGATIAVCIKSRKTIDKSAAFAAALPGIISGPTESCIYGVNLPKGMPFFTGVIAGGIGGWLIGIFSVGLESLAGLGGIVGFLAYNKNLVAAIIIDLATFGIGILITLLIWKEDKTEKALALKTTAKFKKQEFLTKEIDYTAQRMIKIIKTKKTAKNKEELLTEMNNLNKELIALNGELAGSLEKYLENVKSDIKDSKLNASLIKSLKEIKTDRQKQLNQIYVDMNKEVLELKKLNEITKSHLKLVTKKSNYLAAIQKNQDLKEIKTASLFNKGQKLIASQDEQKYLKGNELIQQSIDNTYRVDKITALEAKLLEVNDNIKNSQVNLLEKTDKAYQNIEKFVVDVEKITKHNLGNIKDSYWNDIHNLEIQEQNLTPKVIIA